MLYPQTSAWHQQPFQLQAGQVPSKCIYLPWTHFAQTQEVPDKGFIFHIFTQFKMIFTASSKFWPRVKKMHLNFGTCPHRQEADPNSNWGRYPRTKGLGKSGRAERILQPVYKPGAVGPPG